MITLAQMLRLTPAQIRANARSVVILSINAVMDKDANGVHKKVLIQTRGETVPRFVIIKLYEPDKGQNPKHG